MQTDPIGYGDGMNMYAYVGGDPVNGVDPSGTQDTIIVTGTRPKCSVGATCISGDALSYYMENPIGVYLFSADISGGRNGNVVGGKQEKAENTEDCIVELTDLERQYANDGNRKAFWQSRLERGAPFALTALGVVNNSTTGGKLANDHLTRQLILHGPRSMPTLNEVGVQIMQAHVSAIDRFAPESGVLTATQFAQYHHDVFDSYNLPRTTFGGTMIATFLPTKLQTAVTNTVGGWTPIGRWYDPRCE